MIILKKNNRCLNLKIIKKITNSFFTFLLMITASVYFVSCNSDDKDYDVDDQATGNLRSLKSSPSPGPSEIIDLSGVEVNIRLADASREPRYLSAHMTANSADLTANGNDGWQKWYISAARYPSTPSGTFDLKTNSSPKLGSFLYIHDNWQYPSLLKNYAGNSPQWYFHNIEGTDFYRIGLLKSGTYYYLSAVDASSRALCFEPANSSNYKRQAWEIVPLEEFDLIGIEYDLANGVITNEKITTYRNIPSVNSLSISINKEFTINQKIITTSNFSKTEGTKLGINVTSTIKAGIPFMAGGTIQTSISSEKSWNYSSGGSESKEFSITDKYALIQPANTYYTISVIGTEYEIDVNYKAVYRSKYGKIVRLCGKWSGVTVADTQVVLKDNSNGSILNTRSLKMK